MRALVTGASGFVGRYLTQALREQGDEVFAYGGPQGDGGTFLPLDMTDGASLLRAFEHARPAAVFHLAAQTFVPASFESPLETYRVNTLGTALLTHVARTYSGAAAQPPRIVFASSAEVYGTRDRADFPLRETLDVRPANPYAASKAAAEAIVLAEARSLNLNAVVARSFNHIGPGQSDRFVIASFAHQLAVIAGGGSPVLLVGNLSAARDYLDVRDVVRAYLALARDGEPGHAYNVCSGQARPIRDMLRELIAIARVAVEVRDDPARLRPVDVPILVGSADKLHARTGWRAEIPVTQSLREIYQAALHSAGNRTTGS